MRWEYVLIIICIMIVAVSGCTQDDSPSLNYSSPASNTTNSSTTAVPTTTSSSNPQAEVSGNCYKVVDGDTIDVEGVGRVRFVGVNTPERGEPGYQEAKDYVKTMCLGKTVGLDIDNAKNKDKYSRTLAVVYVDGVNLNQALLKKGYAEVMYIPPSEFNPYKWT
ncbi:thermonuclease family protein [Methanobacterium formicicum]|uniref:Thermonuclease family protein n=1 Tax=Methanobacterium formicicum TaxID=2162 RepID=A0A843AL33_METFO|nr:thermonuclease family protein [Methanobacterium formicicum]MBF4474618.1 thermonuclease family protein [Methanobacterium formicicum]